MKEHSVSECLRPPASGICGKPFDWRHVEQIVRGMPVGIAKVMHH